MELQNQLYIHFHGMFSYLRRKSQSAIIFLRPLIGAIFENLHEDSSFAWKIFWWIPFIPKVRKSAVYSQ